MEKQPPVAVRDLEPEKGLRRPVVKTQLINEKKCFLKVKINGMDRIALVNSGGSPSVVSGMLCRLDVRKNTAILTAGKEVPSKP